MNERLKWVPIPPLWKIQSFFNPSLREDMQIDNPIFNMAEDYFISQIWSLVMGKKGVG